MLTKVIDLPGLHIKKRCITQVVVRPVSYQFRLQLPDSTHWVISFSEFLPKNHKKVDWVKLWNQEHKRTWHKEWRDDDLLNAFIEQRA